MVWDGKSAKRLLDRTSGMFNSRLYSDLKILCRDGTTYYVHKYIVCPQSTFFRNACNPDHGFKEAQEGEIDLSEDDPALVEAVLRFFYYHDYEEPTTYAKPMLVFHVKVFAMGDYFDNLDLQELAKEKFQSLVSEGDWEFEAFAEAIEAIYGCVMGDDRGLRDIVVSTSKNYFKMLKTNQHFLDVAWSIQDFSVEVMTKTLTSRTSVQKLQV